MPVADPAGCIVLGGIVEFAILQGKKRLVAYLWSGGASVAVTSRAPSQLSLSLVIGRSNANVLQLSTSDATKPKVTYRF